MKTDLVIAGYLIHDDKVLLIHHKGLGLWVSPGGHIEENETPDEAVKREFKEELGLDVKILNRNDVPMGGNIVRQLAVPFYVNVHRIEGIKDVEDHHHCCLFYLCTTNHPENLKINKSEIKDCGWFSAEELNQERIPEDVRNIAIKAFELYNSLKNKNI